jgi:hypothetical protein
LANAPSSRERSWRMGCTRITRPSLDSCTDPATIATSTDCRAQRMLHRWGAPAKLIDPLLSTMRVTVSPTVASRARVAPAIATGRSGRPGRA